MFCSMGHVRGERYDEYCTDDHYYCTCYSIINPLLDWGVINKLKRGSDMDGVIRHGRVCVQPDLKLVMLRAHSNYYSSTINTTTTRGRLIKPN